MIDVQGTSLTPEDKELLAHPLIGGVILFTRNYHTPEQLVALNRDIRKAAKKPILLAVDHEGGRVQRFREGFSKIPAMAKLWQVSGEDQNKAKALAKSCGTLMALEVIAAGIDISFAPVLDVNGISDVIGDRAFHEQPEMVAKLAGAFIDGMNQVGMKATAKHFPGHGSVKEDSHVALPVDSRTKDDIFNHDLQPFSSLINAQKVAGVMPAHVIFPSVDNRAVGFSPYWLQDILRQQLQFNGVIFSDDLSMHGASVVGGAVERAEAAQQAGCDMLLTCNDRDAVINVIDKANININVKSQQRLQNMLSTSSRLGCWSTLKEQSDWLTARQQHEQMLQLFAE